MRWGKPVLCEVIGDAFGVALGSVAVGVAVLAPLLGDKVELGRRLDLVVDPLRAQVERRGGAGLGRVDLCEAPGGKITRTRWRTRSC